MKRQDLRIRDPFVLTDKENGKYYLYGTTDFPTPDYPNGRNTFSVYVSEDLEEFDGPYTVFDGRKSGFWATLDYWAAEVRFYCGKYYLFGSFRADGVRRATQILSADSPLGPFAPISDLPQTPSEEDCLDGTLWVEDGKPYLVYCHEWLQAYDGEICAVELSRDLSRRIGEPFCLFKASEHPCVTFFTERDGKKCYVTDGPFLFQENGKLKMIWSSFIDGEYAVLESCSDKIKGAWSHLSPKFSKNGGHSMLFTDLKGKKKLALHCPNTDQMERPVFLDVE